ncbi:MAG: DNA polymerase III subunit beta [Spirochaetota bacterium]|nr:DNA polymerase III subunit beta [Spirochaetota bacterium]
MEFICSKEEIQKSLSYAEGVVSSKTTLSILSNVLIETGSNSLNISSTDLEVGFRTSIPAEVVSKGAITIQAKKLSEIIKSFGHCNLKFLLDSQNRMTISSEDPKIKANFKIVGIPKDDYPNIPTFTEENIFTMNQNLLREIIRKTIFSASTDEARYFLNGIYFEKKGDWLILVATDGKRLSFITNKLEDFKVDDFTVIVPLKVLNELLKILKDDGNVQISLTESKVFFKMNETELVSNLLEGQFPNYNQVIPKESTNVLKITRVDIYEAIKRVSHMVDPKLAQIRFETSDGKLTLSGHHPDFGDAVDEVEAEYDGEALSIAFNYNYLLDALKEVDRTEVFFKMTTNKSPVIIEGLDDESYFSVVMPMKLNEE